MTARILPGLLALTVCLAGCSDDGPTETSLSMSLVAGDYAAEGDYGVYTMTTTVDGQTVDQLAQGLSLTLTLTEDGRTSGRLFMPEGDEDGSDYEADLTGTWTLTGNVVDFSHQADTFIRDMSFRVEGGQLSGDEMFGDTRAHSRIS